MVLSFAGVSSLFSTSEAVGDGMQGNRQFKINSEEDFRGNLASGTNTDVDIFTTATKLKESTLNLEPGTYLITGGLRTDIFDVAGGGWAGCKIWLQHGTTEIIGSKREQFLEVPASSEKLASLQTAAIYSFDGTEQISLYAQMTGTADQSFGHDNNLIWVKISNDY